MGDQDYQVTVIDLAAMARAAVPKHATWACTSTDLNANLIVLDGTAGVARHRNREVDVLLVGISGDGLVEVDGQRFELRGGQALLIPKGTERTIQSGGHRFAYLTCHRRRMGLWPQGIPRPT